MAEEKTRSLSKQKDRKMDCKMLSSRQYKALAAMNAQPLRVIGLGLHENGPTDSQKRMEEGFRGPCPSLWGYFLQMHSRKMGINIFTCEPTGDPWTFLIQWSNRQS